MQTHCPICEEVIRCETADVGKSRPCPVCEINFVVVAIPTQDDRKKKADRRAVVRDYVIPAAATLLLFGSVISAFWQRHTLRIVENALAEKQQKAQQEQDRLAREEDERRRVALAEQTAQLPPEVADVPPQAEIAQPEKSVTAADMQTKVAGTDNSTLTPVQPSDTAELSLLVPEKKFDLRELLSAENDEIDPVRPFVGSRLYVKSDQSEWTVRNSQRRAFYRHVRESARWQVQLPELPEPLMLFPVENQPLKFAAVGADGIVSFLDDLGKLVRQVRISDTAIVDCSLVNGELFYATDDGKAAFYSPSNQRITELLFPSPLRRVCEARDIGYLTGGTDRQVHLFRSHDRPTASFRSSIPIDMMAATRIEGEHVVIVAGNNSIEALSESSGTIFRKDLTGLTVTALAISESHCLSVALEEGLVFVFSLPAGQILEMKKLEGSPVGIEYVENSDTLRIWSTATIETGEEPFQVEMRSTPDPMIMAAATDSEKAFPKNGDPEIHFLQFLTQQYPLAIESLSTDKDSKIVTIRGRGFTDAKDVTVLRRGESSVRLKATVVSDAELTIPWSPRISGGFPMIQCGDRIAVPIPSELRGVVLPKRSTTDVAQESAEEMDEEKATDGGEENEAEKTEDEVEVVDPPPNMSGFRYLTGNQEIASVGDDCEFLLVTGSARISESMSGKAVIVYLSTAELPDAVSDNVRLIFSSSDQSKDRSGRKSTSFSAPEVFPCPVYEGLPLP